MSFRVQNKVINIKKILAVRGSSLHLFLHSAVQIYEFHLFIVSK